jgi:hypothetical protein
LLKWNFQYGAKQYWPKVAGASSLAVMPIMPVVNPYIDQLKLAFEPGDGVRDGA